VGQGRDLLNPGFDMRDAYVGIDVVEHGVAASAIAGTTVLSAALFRGGSIRGSKVRDRQREAIAR
jgi:hypothetical protein